MSKSDDRPAPAEEAADIFTEMLRIQGEAARAAMEAFAPQAADAVPDRQAIDAMGAAMMRLQEMWLEPAKGQDGKSAPGSVPVMADPAQWLQLMQSWYASNPVLDPDATREMWSEGMRLWEQVLAQYGIGPDGREGAACEGSDPQLPRADRQIGRAHV